MVGADLLRNAPIICCRECCILSIAIHCYVCMDEPEFRYVSRELSCLRTSYKQNVVKTVSVLTMLPASGVVCVCKITAFVLISLGQTLSATSPDNVLRVVMLRLMRDCDSK
jgi:hypothetical protein